MSRRLPLGTDYLGRDMLSRMLTGARYTIGVALRQRCSRRLPARAGHAGGFGAAGPITAVSRAMDTLISLPEPDLRLVVIAGWAPP